MLVFQIISPLVYDEKIQFKEDMAELDKLRISDIIVFPMFFSQCGNSWVYDLPRGL